MARILERTLNPRVAPGRILLGHSSDELPDLDDNTAAAGPRCPIRSFARDQLPVPPQQCVWRDDRRDLTYRLSAQPVCRYRQPSPIVVKSAEAGVPVLSPEDTILFNQIRERFPFPAIQPADDAEEQKARKTDGPITSGSLYHRLRQRIRQSSIQSWDSTRLPAGRRSRLAQHDV